jgi:hypothetical protein
LEALDNDGLETVRLVKLDRSTDRADAGKWVSNDTGAKLELRISAATRGKRLMSDLIRRRIGGDTGVFGQIVQLTVGPSRRPRSKSNFPMVRTAHSISRNWRREMHFTADIDTALDENGEPVPASVFPELARMIEDTTG